MADEAITHALDFLGNNSRGVLTTFRSDGRPAMSPVLAARDDEGRVMVSTRETAYKVKHLRADPRVALLVLNDGFFGAWAQLEGDAEIVDLPEAMELLVDCYRRLSGEHEDWVAFREAMRSQQRVLLRFVVTRAGPTKSG